MSVCVGYDLVYCFMIKSVFSAVHSKKETLPLPQGAPSLKVGLGSLAWERSSLRSDTWSWYDLCSIKKNWLKKPSFPPEKRCILISSRNATAAFFRFLGKSSCSNFPLSHVEFPDYQGQKLLKAMFPSESQYQVSFQSLACFPANLEGKHLLSDPPFVCNSAASWNDYCN